MMWQASFVSAWCSTWEVLAALGGGLAAVLLALLILAAALLVLALVLASVFNVATEAMARHWAKTGRSPKNRWAKIIQRGHDSREE